MAAHTTDAALTDGFDAFFGDVHAQVDAGMVGVGEIGSKGFQSLELGGNLMLLCLVKKKLYVCQ